MLLESKTASWIKTLSLTLATGVFLFTPTAQAKQINYKTGTYNGQFTYNKDRRAIPHGSGVYTWHTGKYAKYKGTFSYGKVSGPGTIYYRNGSYCTGNFNSKIKMNGGANCLYASGARYVGNMKNSLRHGSGNMTYNSGAVYNGNWRNGKRHGSGKLRYKSGTTYDGYWVNDKRHTTGRQEGTLRKWENGKRKFTYTGQFHNGKMDGRGELRFHASGNTYCVVMSSGKLVSKRKSTGPRSMCYN